MARELQITLTNEDQNYIFADFTEPIDDNMTTGDIYRQLQREYGRCQSSVYMDTATGTKRVGWYFVARDRYDDTNKHYLRGCWASIREHTISPVNLDA